MNIRPTNYNLQYEVDLQQFIFSGAEVIKITVLESVSEIELDCADLVIEDCHFESSNVKVSSFELKTEQEKLTVILSSEILPGEYELFIKFKGKLEDKLAGFYRTKYKYDGLEKYFATTQFEAADARRAFPCFDSPEFKATFDIVFSVDRHYEVISNTLPFDVIELGDKKIFYFARTPLMSTYILYFGVGEFEFLQSKYKKCSLRIVTTKGKKEYGEQAMEFTKQFLSYFEDYFDYKYVLPKLDLIAVPDFGAGAMENWGAITFRENMLLIYPGQTTKATIVQIAEYIAHEIAHMWFGNLVTMKWWDNLWLNESFATFMAFKALDKFYPEWDVWSDYVSEQVFGGMDLDSLNSSHAIKVEVNSVAEIDETFDKIAYNKGGSILRMLENFIGDNEFRNGLRKYISKYAFKNTIEKDLWTELEGTSEEPVVEIMKKYVEQVGFPVVGVKTDGDSLYLTQERFLLKNTTKFKNVWPIPMVLNVDGNDKKIFLDNSSNLVKIDKNPEFINLNTNYSGFYITNYDEELLTKLVHNWNKLNNKEKQGVLHDQYLLTLASINPLSKFLDFIKESLVNENDSAVLDYGLGRLVSLNTILMSPQLHELVLKIAHKSLDLVGLEPNVNETPSSEVLRTLALIALIQADDEKITTYLRKKFAEYLLNEDSIVSGLRSAVYCASVWDDDKNFDIIWDKYLESKVLDEKIKLLRSLCYSRNEVKIKLLLSRLFGKDIRFSNLSSIFYSMSSNPFAKKILLDWLLENWDDLAKKGNGMGSSIVQRALQSIIPSCGIGRSNQIVKFFEQKDMTGLNKTLAQSLEELEINERVVEYNSKN